MRKFDERELKVALGGVTDRDVMCKIQGAYAAVRVAVADLGKKRYMLRETVAASERMEKRLGGSDCEGRMNELDRVKLLQARKEAQFAADMLVLIDEEERLVGVELDRYVEKVKVEGLD